MDLKKLIRLKKASGGNAEPAEVGYEHEHVSKLNFIGNDYAFMNATVVDRENYIPELNWEWNNSTMTYKSYGNVLTINGTATGTNDVGVSYAVNIPAGTYKYVIYADEGDTPITKGKNMYLNCSYTENAGAYTYDVRTTIDQFTSGTATKTVTFADTVKTLRIWFGYGANEYTNYKVSFGLFPSDVTITDIGSQVPADGELSVQLPSTMPYVYTWQHETAAHPLYTQEDKVDYPEDFLSRIKPDIFYKKKYYVDIDTIDYTIPSASSVWVSIDGNDTTGTGTEENPFATITKALTKNVPAIQIKEGTYIQGTHFDKWLAVSNKNFIGHGNVVFQEDESGHTVTFNGNNYVKNISFVHTPGTINPAVFAQATDSGQCACFEGCSFSGGENGLAVLGVDAVVVDCVSHDNKYDGFNYHKRIVSDVTYIPNVLEINCEAYNNGSESSQNDSCNGSTSHDGARIIRVGAKCYASYGGVIADIGDDSHTTESVNFGVVAHDSIGVDIRNASFWASTNTKMYLYNCNSYGSTYDITAEGNGYVESTGLKFKGSAVSISQGSSATVIIN